MLTAASVSSDGAHAAGEDGDDWMPTNRFMKWAFSCGLCLASRGRYHRTRPRARFHAVPLRYLFASWSRHARRLSSARDLCYDPEHRVPEKFSGGSAGYTA
jgi:hypothetical protein